MKAKIDRGAEARGDQTSVLHMSDLRSKANLAKNPGMLTMLGCFESRSMIVDDIVTGVWGSLVNAGVTQMRLYHESQTAAHQSLATE